MNLLEGGKGGWGREGGEGTEEGGDRGWGGDVGERGRVWGERDGGEGGRGGEGEGRGGMTVIHILIGMFNSNPMIPQNLNNNLT